jgi:hypothetical protein
MKDLMSLAFVSKRIVGFVIVVALMIILPHEAFCSDSLVVKIHIPWGWINDFEFYQDGIFISPYEGNGIGYFTIDSSYNLTHRYTIFPVPSPSHTLAQCCISDSFLFAIDGSSMHPVGEPVFFSYKITDSDYVFLAGLEPSGTVNPAGFDPIVYHNGDIIYSEYPQTFVRVNVTNPASPYVTGKLVNGDYDVCHAIIPYEDTLLITSRQCGSAYWDGNFRLIKNNEPDTLISLGKYGTSRYSYTAGITNIDSILFTAHSQGLVVYDISDFGSVQEIYFYATAWARFIEQVNNYIFMSCNNGWHVFKYVSPSDIQHLQYLANDERILWMKLRPACDELWCFVDEDSLGGLVIFDISDFMGVKEETNFALQNPKSAILRVCPNPFSKLTSIKFQVPTLNQVQGKSQIALSIYDATGRLVKDFNLKSEVSNMQSTVFWNGVDNTGQKLPNGVYFVRLETETRSLTRKVTLLR